MELQSPRGPLLRLSGADLMDGTPIYDIKPYIPYADCRPEAAGNPTAKTIDKIIAGVEENCPELLPERQKKPQPSADR